jgi:Stress responsive A/B Barrel Domain
VIKHVALMWLRDGPRRPAVGDVMALVAELEQIEVVRELSCGPPMFSDWDGIDPSFDVGMILTLGSPGDVPAYRFDPVHLRVAERLREICSDIRAYYISC